MNNIATTSSMFHANFEKASQPILENAMESLLEGPGTCSPDELVAQIIMDMLGSDMDNGDPCSGRLGVDLKARLVRMADHLGPDWAQALYHAAVFITKVA